jgi:hypothetical protein
VRFGDFAAHTSFTVLSAELDAVTFEILCFVRRRKLQIMLLPARSLSRETSLASSVTRAPPGNETERSADAVGSQHTPFSQRRDDAPRMTLGRTRGVRARQFSAIKHGFENVAGFWRQATRPDFFFCPEKDTRTQFA